MHKKKGETVAKFKLWFGSNVLDKIFDKKKYDYEFDKDMQMVYVRKKVKK